MKSKYNFLKLQKRVSLRPQNQMVAIVQLVRISVCGTEGRGFEPHWPPPTGSFSEKENSLSFLSQVKSMKSIPSQFQCHVELNGTPL